MSSSPWIHSWLLYGGHLVADRWNTLMDIICTYSTPQNQPPVRSSSSAIPCTAKDQLASKEKPHSLIIDDGRESITPFRMVMLPEKNVTHGMNHLSHPQLRILIFYSHQLPGHTHTLLAAEAPGRLAPAPSRPEWWQKHMRESVDFLTLPDHSVAVTGIPNVKQKVVRDELGSERSLQGNGNPKESPGIHPSSRRALWTATQNQVRHLEKPSDIPSKISLMFSHKKVRSQVEDHYMSTRRGTKKVCMLLEGIYGEIYYRSTSYVNRVPIWWAQWK